MTEKPGTLIYLLYKLISCRVTVTAYMLNYVLFAKKSVAKQNHAHDNVASLSVYFFFLFFLLENS